MFNRLPIGSYIITICKSGFSFDDSSGEEDGDSNVKQQPGLETCDISENFNALSAWINVRSNNNLSIMKYFNEE
ncbi:unnamed protein product [Lactuca virosa]|uniref:Uncharacterized protein n=1 Tax=Lactuca virosa TaxID=75947 RepID=A0AAU9MR24_9ASTR|nr:unnamed protein product [Lactuca virosa]